MNPDSKIIKVLFIPLLILAGAAVAGFALFNARDKPSKATQEERAVAVETLEVERTEHTMDVEAAGTVIPARQLDVYPQASGRLTWLYESLDPGTFVDQGQALFRIDEQDIDAASRSSKQRSNKPRHRSTSSAVTTRPPRKIGSTTTRGPASPTAPSARPPR
ncbi:MAG: hypothetical protein ACLFVJ_20875, partial [Persicimonas sp.]